MKSSQPTNSLRVLILGPLIGLLLGFIVVFGILAFSFRVEYSKLRMHIADTAEVGRLIAEVQRNRIRLQEVLLLYRINRRSDYPEEVETLNRQRFAYLDRIQAHAANYPGIKKLGNSLAMGLREASFLQNELIRSVRQMDFKRADECFKQIATIFSINSARLKDFSLRLENELLAESKALDRILLGIIWSLALAVLLVALSIWVIALVYREKLLRPLEKLHRGMNALAKGEMNSQIEVRSAPRELFEMTVDFNHMTAALQMNQEKTRQALRLRDEFLSIASHELKTPLTSLRLQTQLIRRKLLKGDESVLDGTRMKNYVEKIDKQALHLNALVEEMLDVSRIEAGGLRPKLAQVDLAELMNGVCEDLSQQLLEAKCTLTKSNSFTQIWGFWDRHQMEQVIVNLMTNAMKYGAGHPIHIEMGHDRNRAWFSVADHGSGVEKKDHQRIFERYERAVSVERSSGGLGLGLYIAKKIVTAHKGEIRIESEKGKGAKFTVELPLQLVTSQSVFTEQTSQVEMSA